MIIAKLNQLLEIRGRTLYWLANETGLSYPTIHQLANEKNVSVSFITLNKICRALECNIDDILEYQPSEVFFNYVYNNLIHSPSDLPAIKTILYNVMMNFIKYDLIYEPDKTVGEFYSLIEMCRQRLGDKLIKNLYNAFHIAMNNKQ